MFTIMITLWFICRKREYTFSYSSIGISINMVRQHYIHHTQYTHTRVCIRERTSYIAFSSIFELFFPFSLSRVESSAIWVEKPENQKRKRMKDSECVSFYQYVRCLINWIPMFAFEISICIAHTSHTRLNYYRNKIRFLVNFLKALRHATFVCNDSTSLKVIIYCFMYVFWLQTCNQVNCSMHRNLWIEWEFLVFLLSHVLLSSAYQNYMVQLPTMMWDTLIIKNS